MTLIVMEGEKQSSVSPTLALALCTVVSFLIFVTVCFEAGKDAMYEAADKIT